MSASKPHSSTHHFQLHSLMGWGLIIGLPFMIMRLASALKTGGSGIEAWLSNPIDAAGFFLFFTMVLGYCKMEMDQVILDYFGGAQQTFGLRVNKVMAVILWLAVVYALIKFAFLG